MAAPLTGTSGSGNKGTGAITQPTLTSELDIYDAAQRADLQTGIKYSTPVKLVFGDDTASPQAYTMYDSKGNAIGSGTIVPGQDSKLQLSVPMVDASGNPIMDGATQKTFSFEMTVSGTPKNGDSFTVAMTASGSADNRNAQSVLDLQTKGTVEVGADGKGISFTDAYAKLVSNVAARPARHRWTATPPTRCTPRPWKAQWLVRGIDR